MGKKAKNNRHSAADHAVAIAGLSPLVFSTRLWALAGMAPFFAALELQRLAVEKAAAATNAAIGTAGELARQSAMLAGGQFPDSRKTTERITAAALKPVAKQVRSNARRKRR